MEELSSLHDVMNRTINVFEKGTITSEIVKTCISKLNSGKDDGDIGFKSDLFSIRLLNYLSTLFYIHIKINFNHLICNLDIKKDTLQRCVFWFIKKLFLMMLTIIHVYIVVC